MSYVIDVQRIAQTLLEEPHLGKIIRDYGVSEAPATPEELIRLVPRALDQVARDIPLAPKPDNRTVFRAAVRAIGSNMRNWEVFVRNEGAIKERLLAFDPQAASRAIDCGTLKEDHLIALLPG